MYTRPNEQTTKDMMTTRNRTLSNAGFPAVAAAVGFLGIAGFQVALALGAPIGQAAWGGDHHGQLPPGLRIGSAIVVAVYLFAALIVMGRAGAAVVELPPALLRRGIWFLVVILPFGALMNFASPSNWERFLWGPTALALAILCFLVARRGPSASGG
jgi:hypothetical protein